MSTTNSSGRPDRIVAALDIGTTKVCLAIGTVSEEISETTKNQKVITSPRVNVIGVGCIPSFGMRKGMVVNIDATTDAIRKAREEAELMAGIKISEVTIGVSGSHIKSFDSKGMVAVRHNEVAPTDIQRVIEAAKAVAVPSDREVLHVLPREFRIDDQGGIHDPIGMSGVRLEANVHIVTGGKSALQNSVKCAERAGLKVAGLVLEQLAAGKVCLSADEKDLGVALVDMGGGTCDLILYVQGAVAYTAVIPVGGMHVTNDIAVGLRTPQSTAENIKKKYGCALSSLVTPDETIEVEGVGGRAERTIMRRLLCDVIEPRIEETLNFVRNEIQRSGFADLLGAGAVLTGGASQLDGVTELGDFVFDMPTRQGKPMNFGGLTDVVSSPAHSTVLGILHHAAQNGMADARAGNGFVERVSSKIRQLFNDAF
jgi:cell division protein FtsA